mmetsp:Transcript_7146/g.15247  ORF Transcript_7146/g.15247 Transcript_7146/m.15247 type:complete len:211 (-) Transcript_7146:256-888(-)
MPSEDPTPFLISSSQLSVSTCKSLSKSLPASEGEISLSPSLLFRAREIETPLYCCRHFWRISTMPSIPSWWLLFINASTVDRNPSSKDDGSNSSTTFLIPCTCSGKRGTRKSPVSGSAAAFKIISTSFARSSRVSSVVSTTTSKVATKFDANAANFSFSASSAALSVSSAIRIKNRGLETTRKARLTAFGSSYGLASANLTIISSMSFFS